MESDILKKIDTLVEMAESSLNIDTAKAELQEIENQTIFLKTELDLLNEEGKHDKYFKASEKQVDENIKVSLEAKIKKQEKNIQELQKEIDNVVSDEVILHDEIAKLQENIDSSNEYISILNDRFSTISDEDNKEYYKNLLQDENSKLDDLVTSLHQKENEHNEVLEHLNYLNLAMDEMQNKFRNEKMRLAETKANLVNPASYIDQELKQIDENRIEEIENELASLDRRRLEILTDPVIIADDAKELIEMDDRVNALAKIQELVTIAKSKPFMDVPSGNALASMIREEEENAMNARDEFASFIDSKNYMNQDNRVIEERINYLNMEIASVEEKIKAAKEEIKNIDTVRIQQLNERLEDTIAVEKELEEDLKNYKIIMESENEDKTPKRRAILSAAFNTKQNELENVISLVNHYQNDQKILIQKAYDLEVNDIAKYEAEIEVRKKEITEMNALLKNTNKVKDVLAIENDKKKLKELDEAVKEIKHRQKYSQTPSEIYDEIEIYLGGMETQTVSFNDDNDFKIVQFDEDINLEPITSETLEDTITSNEEIDSFVIDDSQVKPEDVSTEDMTVNEVSIDIPEINESEKLDEVSVELPTLDDLEENDTSDRIKVIDVEKEEADNSFVIGNYEEDNQNSEEA